MGTTSVPGCGGSSRCRCGCFRCYVPTWQTVGNTTTFATLLSFPYPANAIPLGGILRIRFALVAYNHSAFTIQPTVQLDWGGTTIDMGAGVIGTWTNVFPFQAFQLWGFEYVRTGNESDPTDPDGSFWTQQPLGYDPFVAPFYDPAQIPADQTGSVDFTIDQTPALNVKFDHADPTVRLQPITPNVTSYGVAPF